MDKYKEGIGINAGSLMLKWDEMNKHLMMNPLKLLPEDEVNVFINFECVLRNLSNSKIPIDNVAQFRQQVAIELESSILNMVAHYRAYFKKDNKKPKIYLYYTDLTSDKHQLMEVYNKYYRSYYKNRYMQNPQFRQLGEILTSIVIPEIKLILNYIPDCYFIISETFDSSIIPMIIANNTNAKNVIISGDIFDTMYMFNPNVIMIYIKRRFQYFTVTSDIDATIQSIVKDESPIDLTIFRSEMYYRMLLAIKGSKIRNIKSAKGFGYGRFMKILSDGIKRNVVLTNFSSIDSILNLFPQQLRDDIKNAFQCTSLDIQYQLLSETDKDEIMNQIVDKVDLKSVEALNNKRFFEFPINLQYLL